MRVLTKNGDVYMIPLSNGIVRYFQLITKDSSALFSDVIRIFKHQYDMSDEPSLQEILDDEVELYFHTYVKYGVKWNYWNKYGFSPIDPKDYSDVIFRDSLDYGNYPMQHVVSTNWIVWKINGIRQNVGKLPNKYYNASIGLVYSPESIVQWLSSGKNPHEFYPDY